MSIARRLQNAVLRGHQWLYVTTDGRLGHRLIGVPSLILITTGRRTGRARPAVLIYARDGADYLLVASNDGQDVPPAWLLNVRADSEVGIQVARRRGRGRACVVEAKDADYPRLWRLVNENNHHRYEGYQRRTPRPIAVLVVRPDDPLV